MVVVSFPGAMRPAMFMVLCVAAVSGCHGAQIQESGTGGASGGGGLAGSLGVGGNGGGTGGTASGTAGSGAPPKTLMVVPGTGTPGIAYARMTALEGGTAYPVVLDIYDGPNALAPLVVTKAVQLSDGAATTLSTTSEAVSLLSGESSPVAIDATYVYWFSRTIGDSALLWLRRAPKLGGTREDITGIDNTVTGAPASPVVMATGGGYVYWASTGNGIFRCPASVGCGTGPELVAPTTDTVMALVVHTDWLYWASATTGKVWRHGLTTPGDQMVDGGPTVGPAMTCDLAVSADDTELWSIQCLYPYEVRRVNVTVMSGTTIANAPNETIDQNAAGSLALGADTVYFIGSDHVFSVPRTTTPTAPQLLANLMTASGVLADGVIGIDDQDVYFKGSSSGGTTGNGRAGYVLRMAR